MRERLEAFAQSPWAICAVAAVVSIAAAVLSAFLPLLATDTACRYAPMAEAFAAGEWIEAFHPRFGVGMSVVSGIAVRIFGLDGYSACSMVSGFAWGLGVIPAFRIAERVFDRRTAWFAAVLYIACPQMLVWALKGLREPFKALGILLMADALFRCRGSRWLNFAEAASGLLLLFTFKVDGVAVGCAFALAYAVVDRFRARTWALFAWGALAVQPMCWLVFEWTGVWLPAPQYAPYFNRMFGG